MIAGLNQWDVARFLTRPPYPYTEDDARALLAKQVPPEPGRVHLVIDLPGQGMIGALTMFETIGFWLNCDFHGRGYMTEACVALLDWHFAARPVSIVRSGAHLGNEASLGVHRKLGFTETGDREVLFARAQNRDVEHVLLKLLRTDYEAARVRLQEARARQNQREAG